MENRLIRLSPEASLLPDDPPPPPQPGQTAHNAPSLHLRDRKAGFLPQCNAASGADNVARSDNPEASQSGSVPSLQWFPNVPAWLPSRWSAWEQIATGPRYRDASDVQTILQPATPRQFFRCTSPQPDQLLQPLPPSRELSAAPQLRYSFLTRPTTPGFALEW